MLQHRVIGVRVFKDDTTVFQADNWRECIEWLHMMEKDSTCYVWSESGDNRVYRVLGRITTWKLTKDGNSVYPTHEYIDDSKERDMVVNAHATLTNGTCDVVIVR